MSEVPLTISLHSLSMRYTFAMPCWNRHSFVTVIWVILVTNKNKQTRM